CRGGAAKRLRPAPPVGLPGHTARLAAQLAGRTLCLVGRADRADVPARLRRPQVLVRSAMPARETGKQRASRIPLDYYKGATRLDRWRFWSALTALVLAVSWPILALAVQGQRGGDGPASRGPVSPPRAPWGAR